MSRAVAMRRLFASAVTVAVLWLALLGCRPDNSLRSVNLRGIWVQGRSLQTIGQIDAVLDRAQTGRFNAIFVGVYGDGRTVYPSRLIDQNEKIEPGFDPLAYLVPEAHRRNLQVHAWFNVGRIGDETGSPVLARHPEWGLVGPDGETIAWLNFTRPDARQFVADLILEVIERYKVDGIHFDYTRYPGAQWGFDAYSRDALAASSGLDLNQFRYADLPAYGLFEANALTEPDTAEVLATFANGLPAVTLNKYGQGEVVVLNWQANERTVAADAEILQRSLRRLLGNNGQIYLLRSETNAEEYGDAGFTNVAKWLQDLGWQPVEVAEKDVSDLNADSVLVMPNVYLISNKTAGDLADFVRQGGGVIFIDGPTRAIEQAEIQAITGMKARGGYFSEWTLMTATGDHPLIPNSQRDADLSTYQRIDAQWKDFRAQGVSALIQEVYRRVKAQHPDVIVSATITSDQKQAAQTNLQDWRTWLKNRFIDVLIPRAYVDDIDSLPAVLETWQPAVQEYGRMVFGVIDFVENGKSDEPKAPDRLLAEIEMAQAAGTNGVMVFDLDRLSDEQLQALAARPFAELTQVIRK